MTAAIFFYLLAGCLLVAGAVLRERDVPASGSIGRGRLAHLIGVCLALSVVAAALLTYSRLIELSI